MEKQINLKDRLEGLRSGIIYSLEAYNFVHDAVSYAITKIGERRHISGQELLGYFMEMAVENFGPLTLDVLDSWNITRPEDIGIIVFDLVKVELLSKTEKDTMADFSGGSELKILFEERFKWTM